MNRIFKVIWSKTKHCYVVVSEYAKANTKAAHTGVRVTAAALAAAAVLLAPVDYSTVWAQTATIEVASTDGNTKTDVYTKDGADSKFATWDEAKNKADKTDVQQETAAREAADNEIKEDVAKKANASDVYTKSETDSKVKEAETYTYRKVAAEEKARAEKDNELNERITNEANDIHKTTNELNDRITNVKESLQKEAADTYVSKDDAAVQDGAQVKASNKVGQNLQNLDTALAKETAARVTSEKTQNEAIATVNTNLVTAVAAINQNVSDGFTALNQADANEAAAREQADTELSNRVTTVESKTTDLSYDEKTKTTTVNDKLAAGSAKVTNSIEVGHNANIGGAVNAGSLNSRGNLNVDGNALVKGTLTSQSTINGKEIVSQTNITAKNKVVGMQGVVDNTLTSGTYVTAGNTVGQNINALDEQVKTNAETANQLQHSLAAEATAREAGDNALNNRITAVKESLQKETADTYVSKDDASVEDGYVIKKANKIGENVALVDKALSDEAAARVTADKAQNEAIATVNTNLVNAVSTINQNVSDGFAALNQADANETKAREDADTALTNRIAAEETDRAEADTALQNAIDKEAADRKTADTTLQTNINNEAAAREAADTALDSRTTALEAKTEAITYDKDSKTVMVDGKLTVTEGITDGTTQDGQYVKMDNYVGRNLNALDQGIQAETTARQAADKTLQDNIDAEAAARKDADEKLDNKIVAEKNARVEADTKLTEAVNNGLSLSDDNVLQKNTTAIDENGTVTTSKTAANEMIMNKGKDNQITLNEKGIKVGTNSTVVNKDGVYTGGDTYNEAKAGMKSDGSIKGADGKFTVNSANGTVNVNDQIELNGATGNVKANSLNIGDGNFKVNSNGGVTAAGGKTTLASDGSVKAADGKFTVNSNGGVKAADGKITLSSDGSVKAADGKFTVNTNGGVKAADGKITLASDGSVKAADGKFTVDTNGAVKAANGNTTIDSNGNIKTVGTLSAADGSFKVDNTGKITSTGLDAGNGTIQTTGTVKAGDVQTGTLETTGDAKIGGNLTVEKNLTVNGEFNAKTLASRLDENNYTEIHGGNVTSKNLKYSDTGELQASSSKLDETGSTVWARDDESIGTSTVTADSIKQSLSKTGDNTTSYASRELSQNKDNKFEMTDRVVDGDNTNTAKKTAIESSSILAGKDGLSSTFKQNVSEILNQINKSDTEYAKVDQKVDNITSEVKNGDNSTSTTQTATDIVNTAEHGTISNNAKNLTNTASENITNTSTNGNISNIAANGTITNEAKNISNKAAEALTNDAKTITNTASESVMMQIGDGSVVKSVMNENGIANTAADKAITNDAADITNTGTNSVTNQVGTNKVLVNNDKVETAYGDDTYTTWDASGIVNSTTGNMSTTVGGSQTTNVTGDSSLTAENINNTAKNKITNKALDVETEAASSIVNKVANDYGTNTSTQTSSQTQEEMSLEDGKTASYLRGAGEAKSQLTNGDTKTTIDTVAGQTNINITDGTNTTVVNQDAKSLASSITDGTKANNTSNTVDQSAQVIKASDTKYSSSTKTAGAFNDTLVSGDSIVNILKDADNGFVQSNVSKGDNSTSVKQTSTDITNTAKNGTIANEAKNISNSATEKLSNSAAEIENTATTSITSKVGNNVSNTMSTDSIVNKVGTTTVTTTDGKTKLTNEAGTHETEMDYATVLKDLGVHGNATVDQNLTVKGDSDLQGNANVGKNLTVNGTSDLKGDVTMESNATVKKDLTVKGTTTTNKLVVENGATVTGGTMTDTLHVTSKSTFDGPATFKDIVTMEKDLTVGGNAAVTGSVTAGSYKVGDTTYIDANGINANNQKVTNVAAGDLSAASTDAVNGSQLYSTNQRVSTVENRVDGVENRVSSVENRVDKMDSRIDKVGANAAAMANLHPLEFDEDSKWNVSAAVGNYKGETAAAVGAFYRPNEDVMFNLSTTFGNDENMVGGGVSLRLGKGGSHEKDKKLKAALAENNDLRSKVDNLTARMDALLSVLNPSMSKEFPDVPANHWAYEAVTRLAGNNIVEDYEDGKFHGERTMTRYEMAEIIYNALSKGAKAEKKLVEEFKPELQAMAAQKQAK
ncbi:MAG: hypothetical protein ACFWTM_06795 [Mitsuokella multacida]